MKKLLLILSILLAAVNAYANDELTCNMHGYKPNKVVKHDNCVTYKYQNESERAYVWSNATYCEYNVMTFKDAYSYYVTEYLDGVFSGIIPTKDIEINNEDTSGIIYNISVPSKNEIFISGHRLGNYEGYDLQISMKYNPNNRTTYIINCEDGFTRKLSN